MKWIKKNVPTILLAIVFLIGAGLLLYPSVSDMWNTYRQSRLIAAYTEQVDELDDENYEQMLAEAEAYNEKLSGLTTPIEMSDEALEEYNKLLDVTGTGIMGYIEIDKIDCKLPIYHTADDEVMQLGAGHLEGTSLPVGGESTHSVICGHRGLPSSKLFTDLDQMEVGDNFVIHILNETLTYEVDQILVVDPDDTSALGIEEGKDLVTLFTCTPYGINTHRLLVRGHRVPNTEESVEPVSTMSSRTIKASFIIAVVFIVIMVLVLVVGRKKSKK